MEITAMWQEISELPEHEIAERLEQAFAYRHEVPPQSVPSQSPSST